jgi:LmbE family N-acetylglucosaminyl deacetylase
MQAKNNQKHVLLAVLAHPDDESFGIGGTLALYASRGVQVHLICATRGEVGQMSPEHLAGYSSIAERRESELRCAAGILGLAGVHFLDYRDSGMNGSPDNQHPQALINQPLELIASKIARLIRELCPQVVITFDPIGGYKHPDHIAIHRATIQAFQLAGALEFPCDLPPYQPQKLYYHVFPKNLLRLAVSILPLLGRDPRHFGSNGDIDLVTIAREGNFPTHARINIGRVADKKGEAATCHASQLGGGPPRSNLLRSILRFFDGTEDYMRAIPPAEPGVSERDLFAGVA